MAMPLLHASAAQRTVLCACRRATACGADAARPAKDSSTRQQRRRHRLPSCRRPRANGSRGGAHLQWSVHTNVSARAGGKCTGGQGGGGVVGEGRDRVLRRGRASRRLELHGNLSAACLPPGGSHLRASAPERAPAARRRSP
eukprot:scaffold25494_cov146-Isochrysis_galbana.AAC.4